MKPCTNRLNKIALAAAMCAAAAAPAMAAPLARHVLLISVDGLHAADLANWVAGHPSSALAALASHGTTYANARTTTPSDSFPGLLALVTGGTPKSTGVYYDDSYDRTLFAPGSQCSGPAGIEAVFDESIDHDATQLFSGGIQPAYLPLQRDADGSCAAVWPHAFVKVNTVFEVVHATGHRTAWADKHPAYDLVNGPSGTGVDDLYTPEINSPIDNGGTVNGVNLAATKAMCDGTNSLPVGKVSDYTTCLPSVQAYDDVKVQALVNEIDGRTSDGGASAPVPVIFGMNFQAVSVGQKLPVGGYADAAGTPSANLAAAIAHTDASIGRLVAELKARHLFANTLVVVSAKHGQSPIDLATLQMESGGHGDTSVQDPSGFIAAVDPRVDSPSSFTNPNSGATLSTGGHLQTDDVGLVWLQDSSRSHVQAVAAQLRNNAASIHASHLPPGTVLGSSVESGFALASLYGDPSGRNPIAEARAPDIVIQPDAGVIYSGSSKKIAEHGGGTLADTHVALLVAWPASAARIDSSAVMTTQVAPTMLRALGLDPLALQAVRQEGTKVLPGLFEDRE